MALWRDKVIQSANYVKLSWSFCLTYRLQMKEIISVWLRVKLERLRGPLLSEFRVSSVLIFTLTDMKLFKTKPGAH